MEDQYKVHRIDTDIFNRYLPANLQEVDTLYCYEGNGNYIAIESNGNVVGYTTNNSNISNIRTLMAITLIACVKHKINYIMITNEGTNRYKSLIKWIPNSYLDNNIIFIRIEDLWKNN